MLTFIPPKDILQKRRPLLQPDDKVSAWFRVRWGPPSTRDGLAAHQEPSHLPSNGPLRPSRHNRRATAPGRFMHFNGHVQGFWRRTTIDGRRRVVEHDTLHRKIWDLSYRCQMKGWAVCVYLPQFCAAPAELPPEMIALSQQAHPLDQGLSADGPLRLLPKGFLKEQSTSPRGIKVEAFFPPDQYRRLSPDGPSDPHDVPDVLRRA